MLNPTSSALPGLSAAERRLDAQAVNLQSKDPSSALPTAGAPISEAAMRSQQAPPPSAVSRDGVEASSATERESGFDGTYASLRSSTPAYLAAYDGEDLPDERASTASEKPDASQARADKTRQERDAASEVVQKQYDVGTSY